jgi:diguanylate cyclase (GGDEF)-like protein
VNRDRATGLIRSWAWLIPLVVGLPALVGYFLLPPEAANIAYEGFGLSATLAVVVGVRLHRPNHARLWLLIGVGFALWTCGDVVSALLAPDGGDVPVPSLADLFYCSGYLALIIGVARLAGPMIHGSALERPALLDALMIATTLGITVWLLLVNPLLTAEGVALDTAVVSAAYPILDILIILVVSRHLLINGPKPIAAILLTAGLTSYLIADLLNIGTSIAGEYSASGAINLGWLLGYLVAGSAVLHPSIRAVGETDGEMRPISFLRQLLLASAAVVPAVVIVAHDNSSGGDRLVLGLGTTLLIGIVMLRLFGALRDGQALRERIVHEARHDPLTGLANRLLFGERLAQAVASRRVGVGLLYLDLDEFKGINDTLGHEAGDRLLVQVADRLRACLRTSDDIARLGGDEFAVIVTDSPGEDETARIATRVLDAFSGPFRLDGEAAETMVRASIGLAWAGAAPITPAELLRRADVAMYAAKRTRSQLAIHRATMDHDRPIADRLADEEQPRITPRFVPEHGVR